MCKKMEYMATIFNDDGIVILIFFLNIKGNITIMNRLLWLNYIM